MDFRGATDALAGRITHDELASALGIDVQRVRQARLPDGNPNRRPPPPGWERAVAALARERCRDLTALADQLDPLM